MSNIPQNDKINIQKNKMYVHRNLTMFNSLYTSLDTSRMTLLYFSLSSLSILKELDSEIKDKPLHIKWIMDNYIEPDYDMKIDDNDGKKDDNDNDGKKDNNNNNIDKNIIYKRCGFRPGPYLIGMDYKSDKKIIIPEKLRKYDLPNLAMTYSAIISLILLGDDLSNIDLQGISQSLRYFQNDNGSFSPTHAGGECDLRFVYCACILATITKDFTGFNVDKAVEFIINCQAYDGAFGLTYNGEGHGGSTYCAVSSLSLLGKLDKIKDRDALERWLILNQGCGFVGRPNKPADTCYSFWVGASMKILGIYKYSSPESNRKIVLNCAGKHGGFSKLVSSKYPDVLHSYFGLAGLSIVGHNDDNLEEIDVQYGCIKSALKALREKQEKNKSKKEK